jgi:hypothetical protein
MSIIHEPHHAPGVIGLRIFVVPRPLPVQALQSYHGVALRTQNPGKNKEYFF